MAVAVAEGSREKKRRKYSKRNATNFALVCPKREK
jgi:hypothetical protein